MTRVLSLLAATWLVTAAIALAGAGPVLADDPRDPASSAGATTGAGAPYDLSTEPAIPYIVALLVTSAGLTVVGLIALRMQTPRRRHQRPPAGSQPTGTMPDASTAARTPIGDSIEP